MASRRRSWRRPADRRRARRLEGADKLGDVERLAARRHRLGDQPRPGATSSSEDSSLPMSAVWRGCSSSVTPAPDGVGPDQAPQLGRAKRGVKGAADQQRELGRRPPEPVEHPQRGPVGPVEVVEGEGDRASGAHALDERDHRFDYAGLGLVRSASSQQLGQLAAPGVAGDGRDAQSCRHRPERTGARRIPRPGPAGSFQGRRPWPGRNPQGGSCRSRPLH